MKSLVSFYKILINVVLLLSFTGCVKNDDFNSPKLCMNSDLAPNATYEQVKQLYKGEIIRIQEDLLIEGYVTSSDKAGNFFGTLHFQNKIQDPTEGFQIDIDLRDYHLQYEVGSKIYIRLKGLYLGKSKETFKLGGLFTNAGGTLSVGRLPANLVEKHLVSSCDAIITLIPEELNIDQLNLNRINTLVSIKDIQIAPVDVCKEYAEDGTSTERTFENCSGTQINLINSGFSDFQSVSLPTGNGKITGILGYASGEYHLVIRDTLDMVMNPTRCDGTIFSCEPPAVNKTILQLKERSEDNFEVIDEPFVIEGVITATDESGNFVKEIYIQDETGGIKINLNSTKLFEKGFTRERSVIINCEGLVINDVEGEQQMGVLINDNFESISEAQFFRHLYLQESEKVIEPLPVELSNLKKADIGRLVNIAGLQFTYPQGSYVKNNELTIHPLNDCSGGLLNLSTLRTAVFGAVSVPDQNGSIQGIVSWQNGNYVLRIRDENDLVNLTANRCDLFQQASLISMTSLRTIFQGEEIQITDNLKIKGTVISDRTNGNFENRELVLQDDQSGITVLFTSAHELSLYQKVELALWNSVLRLENGLLVVDNMENATILNAVQGVAPVPVQLDISEANHSSYESMLVTLEEVQFTSVPGVFEDRITVTNCDEDLLVSTRTTAAYYNGDVPESRGNLTGIMSRNDIPILRMRNLNDFETTGTYVICSVNESQEVFISELADPDNNADARFVELYNAGSIDVSFEGWKLIRYTNDNTTISSQIDLSGYKIKAGKTFVISPHADIFEEIYGFAPNFSASANGAADSNGDDNLVLVNSQNEIVDVFGIIGEDGSGTSHEFEDGRAYRKAFVDKGSITYNFEEWILYNDTGANGTTNQPQNAPDDFSPGIR